MAAIKCAKVCLLLGVATALSGCQFRPDILSAYSRRADGEEIVEVMLRAADAKKIKDRELYFSVVVVNCTGEPDPYPAESFIGGERAARFGFETTGNTTVITGRVPGKIFDAYQRPCVFLEGGGYLTGTIKSTVIPVAKTPST